MARHEDIAFLSMSMRTCYGAQWKHNSPEAMQVWANALVQYSRLQINSALAKCVDHYVNFAPTLPQFLELLREAEPSLTDSGDDNFIRVERVYSYAQPQNARNSQGNPHQIKLAESIASRRQGESAERYEKRIADEVTFARYPKMRSKDHIKTPI